MKLISRCPVCNGPLQIQSLHCQDCGLELRNDFELSPFDKLDADQTSFLLCFLRCRGNLSLLQNELQISYPAAKKRLSDLLTTLALAPQDHYEKESEVLDMKFWHTNPHSTKASEIIKNKMKEAGGHIVVRSISGNTYEIFAEADGKSFSCSALPIRPSYTYEVFDVIVDLLLSQGGRAKKGLGRQAKLGMPGCEETTVVGAIGKNYSGKVPGESVFDPVFVLSAMLDWAGIAHNERGYLELTAEYRVRLHA